MISPNEKRFREIENKIAIYQTLINEQKEKLSTPVTFPAEIAQLRNFLEALSNKVDDHFFQFNQLASTRDKTIVNDQHRFEFIDKAINEVNSVLDGLSRQIESLGKVSTEIRYYIENIDKENAVVKTKNLEINKRLSEIESKQQFLSTFSNNLQGLIHDQKNKITILENKNESLQESFRSNKEIQNKFRIDFENTAASLKENILDLTSRIDGLPVIQNNDEQFSAIKNDVAKLSEKIEKLSQENPEQEKINTKIKSLEISVAQIYQLLKKFEPR